MALDYSYKFGSGYACKRQIAMPLASSCYVITNLSFQSCEQI